MFWRFGFSSTSTLDTLLDRPNVTLEEILDEDELLQECKTQNSKLISYLQQPRVLKRLFEHVVGTAEVGGPGGREWEEKVRFKYPYICSEVLSSDIWSIVETSLEHSEELLLPFWEAILSRDSIGNPPTVTQHQHPLFAADAQPIRPGTPASTLNSTTSTSSSTNQESEQTEGESSNVGVLGLEVKANDEGSTVTNARDNGPGKNVLAGYWAKVNGVFLDKKPREMIAFIKGLPNIVETFVAHMETPAVVDLLYRIVQCEEVVPNIGVIDWLSSQDLMPRLIDLLSPSHSTDMHNTVSELLKAIIALSAPSPASLTQSGGTEAFGFGGSDSLAPQANGPIGGVNNRLVRELASETIVRKMVGFMLDASLPSRLSHRLSEAAAGVDAAVEGLSDVRQRPSALGANLNTLSALQETSTSHSGDSAIDDDDDDLEFEATVSRRTPLNPRDTPASEQKSTSKSHMFDHHRDSTATIRPSSKAITPIKAPEVEVTPESCTSTLVTCIGVLIELIRKNNSDYFEQHLFHTLRTHLLQRQQEIAERKANKTVTSDDAKDEEAQLEADPATKEKLEQQDDEEDDEMEGMEEAMAELSDKLGIVHLGPMLNVLCERLSDFQQLIARPRVSETNVVSSLGRAPALTFERYRITELYAELLHCSNMALLNRPPNEGPQYSDEGVLLGGIEGLQVLARTLQGTDAASDAGQEDVVAEKAVEQPSEELSAEGKTDETTEDADESSPTRSQSKSRGHTRQSSTVGGGVGGNGSEDTDDEALLSEVSLSETNDTDASGKNSSVTNATTEGEKRDGEDEEISNKKIESTDASENDDEAEEIKSVLSHMSLADLTSPSPAPSGPPSPIDGSRDYVVGDRLKIKFLEFDVITTILDMFFEFPWNNFLHNVIYDILQQFFNGRMDVGLNRRLTLAVFDQGRMTEKIVQGHERNEESLKSPRRIRMGYMGHMHLIAEETVKLLERYPQEIGRLVQSHLTPEWERFVNETLKENREKEAAPLAGGRPQMMHSLAFPQQSGGDSALGGAGGGPSAGSDAFASYLSSQMGGAANGSDDDDSDEDTNWLSHNLRQRTGESGSGDGFDDAFAPDHAFQSRRGHSLDDEEKDEDDDDDWGPFTDSAQSGGGGTSLSSAQAYLTPADWAADFHREQSAADDQRRSDDFGDDSSSTASPVEGEHGGEEDGGDGQARSDSSSNSDQAGSTPFVDLFDSTSIRATDVVAAAHARRPSLGQMENAVGDTVPRVARPRTASSGGSSDRSAGENADDEEEPLGPGIAPDAQADHTTGLIERTIDGETIKVPLDDMALASKVQTASSNEDESAIE